MAVNNYNLSLLGAKFDCHFDKLARLLFILHLWQDNCWAYLQPCKYKNEKFAINDCENTLKDYGKIDISGLLEDIATD